MSERGTHGLDPRVSLTTLRFIPQGVPHDTRPAGVPLTPCALLEFCPGCDLRLHCKPERQIRLQSVFEHVREFHRKTVSSVSGCVQHFFGTCRSGQRKAYRLQSVFENVGEFPQKTVSSVSCYVQYLFACVDLANVLQPQVRIQLYSPSKAYLTAVIFPVRPRYSQTVGFARIDLDDVLQPQLRIQFLPRPRYSQTVGFARIDLDNILHPQLRIQFYFPSKAYLITVIFRYALAIHRQ